MKYFTNTNGTVAKVENCSSCVYMEITNIAAFLLATLSEIHPLLPHHTAKTAQRTESPVLHLCLQNKSFFPLGWLARFRSVPSLSPHPHVCRKIFLWWKGGVDICHYSHDNSMVISEFLLVCKDAIAGHNPFLSMQHDSKSHWFVQAPKFLWSFAKGEHAGFFRFVLPSCMGLQTFVQPRTKAEGGLLRRRPRRVASTISTCSRL